MRGERMVRLVVMSIALLTTFMANTATTDFKYKKVVDHKARMMYYRECKLDKGEGCHFESFKKSVRLQIIR
jgi:hypothetical protein